MRDRMAAMRPGAAFLAARCRTLSGKKKIMTRVSASGSNPPTMNIDLQP